MQYQEQHIKHLKYVAISPKPVELDPRNQDRGHNTKDRWNVL
ncbi:hypothetical protein BT93_L2555 [Corymbia citriodora subsp. variegata]|uniref:Uncharacterized protein n=1 Tax=Corymbia citriodora subsp. variegata TaxID=360336 RepID=A0A8T0CP05_CORYI|nr:hypothetical protein BT93_L2555 [Corymbia citriodora subsp. variegata]